MNQYRKKPVVIEAKQATGTPENNREIINWTRGSATPASMDEHPEHGECLSINTLEGAMWARPGDWIIKGVKGEFYPCKPGIFAATYEAAPVMLPVIDPEPDAQEREIAAKTTRGCRGPSCGATDGPHSPECILEAAETQGWLDSPEAEEARQALAAKSAALVTLADIEAEIGAEYSFTLDKVLASCPLVGGLDRVTVAVIVLRNGTKLVGVNYGAIDPANHCPKKGKKEARAHAIEQAWPLLGFRLRDKLAAPM